MSTIIGGNGDLKSYGSGSLKTFDFGVHQRLIGIKAVHSSLVDASAGVTLSWESAAFDTSKFITSFPTTDVVIPQDGWYSAVAFLTTSEFVAHQGLLSVLVNGVVVAQTRNYFPAGDTTFKNSLNVSVAMYYCTRGDIWTVVWDTNGVNIDLDTTGEQGCYFAVWRNG